MTIYLPIAEIPINIFLLFFVGGVGGILAGMFGIGGGFLITPILIFLGVPPSVAVATSANQIIASSVTGFMGHWYKKNVDIKLGMYLLVGGVAGSYIGIMIFSLLKKIGQIDLAISLIYVLFLGSIGVIMALESGRSLLGKHKKVSGEKEAPNIFAKILGIYKLKAYLKTKTLPFHVKFEASGLDISAILPLGIGLFAGVLVSIMGIGGGFIMIPAMIYLLKMPSKLVVGTSLFQIIFITSIVTIMHTISTQSVDVVLALILIVGGVIGAQMGLKMGAKLPAEKMRFVLSVIILIVCLRLAVGLFFEPSELFTIEQVFE
ncbi:MAG TPA: permease [Alphaproteobacteria bacterium]|nr:permease [Alphaproteobacteria bacterium]